MQGLLEADFSFKDFFSPLTTTKAVTIIIIVGIIVYANMLFNGFVWDDINYIIDNPQIYSFNIPHLLFDTGGYVSNGFYRPLPALYFSMLVNLF